MIWVMFVLIICGCLVGYSYIPGKQGHAHVPQKTSLILSETSPTLLVFIHPKCTCSQATLEELGKLLPEIKGTKTFVVFNVLDENWNESEHWETVKKLSGVTAVSDRNGIETKNFGVETSGHAILLDENRRIVFAGGLTAARGHTGESTGGEFIRSWHRKRGSETLISKVFGCGLFGE